jgi:hypothetical protein
MDGDGARVIIGLYMSHHNNSELIVELQGNLHINMHICKKSFMGGLVVVVVVR